VNHMMMNMEADQEDDDGMKNWRRNGSTVEATFQLVQQYQRLCLWETRGARSPFLRFASVATNRVI
jgi:hypothetical protein